MSPVVLLLVASLAAVHAFPQLYVQNSPGYSAVRDGNGQANVDTEHHKFVSGLKTNSKDGSLSSAASGSFLVSSDDGIQRKVGYIADEDGFRTFPGQ